MAQLGVVALTDYFLDALQLNTGNIKCNVTNVKVRKEFNNAIYPVYQRIQPIIFPVSGGTETYSFELVLWGRGIDYSELLNKEAEIRNLIHTQVLTFNPIRFSTTDLPIYFTYNLVNLLFDEYSLGMRGSDGKSFISLTFNCIVVDVGIEDTESVPSGVASMGVATFMVGSS